MKTQARALRVSVALSVLFLVVYGGCNWITAHRANVGVFYFEWERGIPFVSLFILPYLSIDLFFVAAPFLLRTEPEMKLFAKRVTTAILIAGIFFLAMPLRYGFARPQATGWTGALFARFLTMDAPFNLFPSLHAALWLLLLNVYARQLRGLVRLFVLGWFALIGASPLLTHQHHLIDILGGLVLGAACLFDWSRFASPAHDRPQAP